MRRLQIRWPHVLTGLVVAAACAVTYRVAANAPTGQYTVTAGTVHDAKTNLTWQQVSPTTGYTWSAATSYCAQNLAGLPGGPWRLPNVKELQTIVDDSQIGAPMIDFTAFTGVNGTPSWAFWSSSPQSGSTTDAWVVDFGYRGGDSGVFGTSITAAVRCVR